MKGALLVEKIDDFIKLLNLVIVFDLPRFYPFEHIHNGFAVLLFPIRDNFYELLKISHLYLTIINYKYLDQLKHKNS